MGIFSNREAQKMAMEKALDLVEISPNANPPVCTFMDYNKYKYEQKIRQKEENQKQKSNVDKEIYLRYCTGDHDVETKINQLKKFLEDKRCVKVIFEFKHRELPYKDKAQEILNRIVESVKIVGTLETQPKLNGKNLVARIVPVSK